MPASCSGELQYCQLDGWKTYTKPGKWRWRSVIGVADRERRDGFVLSAAGRNWAGSGARRSAVDYGGQAKGCVTR